MIDINNYAQKLSEIIDISEKLDGGDKLQTFAKEMKDNLDTLSNANKVLKIGVVGQVKAGKSSFLNSLIFNGDNVLPKASTPMTAGLTVLQYAETNSFEVEYYNTKEWADFESKAAMYHQGIDDICTQNPGMSEQEARQEYESKNENSIYVSANELVARCTPNARKKVADKAQKDVEQFSDIKDLAQVLENYVGAKGEYTSVVKCLVINLNDPRLKDIQIVDTPGVNDPVISREERTRKFLGECHGVFFLSFSGSFFDTTDVEFLDNRIGANGIGSVVVVASKFDSALCDIAAKYDGNLQQAVEHTQDVLRTQFQNNFNASQYKRQGGEKPLIDFSCGIGYSISHKPENEWDEDETSAVKNMKKTFPNFFGTIESLKENFNLLSSIDDIRGTYLESKFKQNRDKIIAEKSEKYIISANKALKDIFKNLSERLAAQEQSVKNSDGSDLEEKRRLWKELVSSVTEDLSSVANRVSAKSAEIETQIKNSWSFIVNVQTRYINNDSRFKIKRSFFGGKFGGKYYPSSPYKLPQLSATQDVLMKALTKLDDTAFKWKEKCEPLTEIIKETVSKSIKDAEIKDAQGKLDARALYNIVYETIDEMFNVTTLDVSGLKSDFYNQVSDFVAKFDPKNDIRIKPDTVFDNENALNEEIRRQASALVTEAQMWVNAFTKDLQNSLNNKLRESREAVQNLLNAKRVEMEEKIRRSADKYVAELQNKITEYQKNKEAMDAQFRQQNENINKIKQIL